MPEITHYTPGQFSWMEVGTTDTEAARKFYGGLFGWTFKAGTPDSEFSYWLIRKDGKDLGGLYELMKEMQQQGVPPHWMSYVNVESADASTEKIKQLGGQVMMEPMDVMDHGRMAVAVDPTGAAFSIWEARTHIGALLADEPDTVCWHELCTRDTDKAGAFYTNLFGWTTETAQMGGPVPYTMFKAGNAPAAGMMFMDENFGSAPPHWMIYFSVEDCEKSVAAAKDLGGNIIVPPMDVPKVGRFSIIADPQDAVFSVIKLS